MVKHNYNEPDKVIFATWVDKALDVVLFKRNIKSGFKVTRIWPFNPKVMDGKTKRSELHAVDHKNNTSNEDNEENSDETIIDIEG